METVYSSFTRSTPAHTAREAAPEFPNTASARRPERRATRALELAALALGLLWGAHALYVAGDAAWQHALQQPALFGR